MLMTSEGDGTMEHIVVAREADHGTVSGMIGALCARYRFLCVAPIGRSVQGRNLWGLTLGSGKRRVLIAATFHASEWLTTLVCLRLCEELCYAIARERPLCGWDVRRAMAGRSIVFVPMVNPDGVEIALHDPSRRWQANADGVDLNHNFNAGWEILQQFEKEKGINGPCSRQWGGPCAESEPETKALVALCRRADFRHVVALHSQGEEIYWQYGEHTPSESYLMAMSMAAVSGYRVGMPTGLASHGGFKDWFIEEFHRPGFTLELGKGNNPLPLSDFEMVYEKAREMLLLSAFL